MAATIVINELGLVSSQPDLTWMGVLWVLLGCVLGTVRSLCQVRMETSIPSKFYCNLSIVSFSTDLECNKEESI